MFLRRVMPAGSTQKSRRSVDVLHTRLSVKSFKLPQFSLFFIAQQGGFLSTRCVSYFFTYSRKLLQLTKRSTKLWFNIPSTHAVTRKALNVRMGKGKGARIGVNAKIIAGAPILALSAVRRGLWLKLNRFIRARCSFRIFIHREFSYNRGLLTARTSTPALSTTIQMRTPLKTKANKLLVQRYIRPSISELYSLLQKLKKIKLFIYFYKIFRHHSPKFYILGGRRLHLWEFYAP